MRDKNITTVEVKKDYGTHHYSRTMKYLEDITCPYCTYPDVWQETDPGDYYLGSCCICTACNSSFHELSPADLDQYSVGEQIKQATNDAK